jgi:hypothetical protein
MFTNKQYTIELLQTQNPKTAKQPVKSSRPKSIQNPRETQNPKKVEAPSNKQTDINMLQTFAKHPKKKQKM